MVATAATFENVKEQKERAPEKQRNVYKLWWSELYQNHSDQDFKSEMRLKRDTFKYILDAIHDQKDSQAQLSMRRSRVQF